MLISRHLLLVVSYLISTCVWAQTDTVEELVVTGKVLYADQVYGLKTPTPIIDVPQALSIVTEADIRRQGYREIGDIIRYTAGVNTTQGEGHRDAVVFRGVRSTADFYIDGARDDVQYYRSLYNLEQVEILRGPNALLFGRGGTGGIINRVSKKPKPDEVFGAVAVGIDSFGASDLVVDYNVNGLRLLAHSDSLDNHRDHYSGKRLGFNPSWKWQPNQQTTINLTYEYADHERFIDRGIPTNDGRPVARLAQHVFGTSETNLTTLKAHVFRADVHHQFSDTSKGAFSLTVNDFDKVYQNLYVADYDDTAQIVTIDGYRDPTERSSVIASASWVKEFKTGSVTHTFLAGAEIINTNSDNLRYDAYWSTNTLGADNDDREQFIVDRASDFSENSVGASTEVDFTSYLNRSTASDISVSSVFLQNQMDLSAKFKLLLGGRFDSFDISVTDIKADSVQSRKDDVFSPRAGLIFKPRKNVSIYWSMSESFLPRSGEQYRELTASASRLDPDVFNNEEVGLKWDISSEFSLTAAYFNSEQTQATRDQSGEQQEIVGFKVDGIEIELKGYVSDSLYLAFGYSALDGTTAQGGTPRERYPTAQRRYLCRMPSTRASTYTSAPPIRANHTSTTMMTT